MRFRKAAGLTGDRLAAQLGWPRSKVPKLENGRQMPTEADLTAWAQATGHPDAATELLDMLAEARLFTGSTGTDCAAAMPLSRRNWTSSCGAPSASATWKYCSFPACSRPPTYARYRALEAVRLHGTAPDGVEATVAARMRRQEVLYDTSKTFEFIITEAALRYLPCPPRVMYAQLERLTTVSSSAMSRWGSFHPIPSWRSRRWWAS